MKKRGNKWKGKKKSKGEDWNVKWLPWQEHNEQNKDGKCLEKIKTSAQSSAGLT